MRKQLEKVINYHKGALDQINKDIDQALTDKETHEAILEDLMNQYNHDLSPEKQAEAEAKGYREDV